MKRAEYDHTDLSEFLPEKKLAAAPPTKTRKKTPAQEKKEQRQEAIKEIEKMIDSFAKEETEQTMPETKSLSMSEALANASVSAPASKTESKEKHYAPSEKTDKEIWLDLFFSLIKEAAAKAPMTSWKHPLILQASLELTNSAFDEFKKKFK